MKTRSGFVSNSSSSSFVILGVKVVEGSKEYNHIKELFYDVPADEDNGVSPWEWELPNNVSYITAGDNNDQTYFGEYLAQGEYTKLEEFSFNDLKRKSKELADLLEVPESDVRLVVGTEYI
jgi:hypothetical protein